ncbi:MAG: hypothetical protein FJ137_09770 [Deltaproteobacteria bacterium]|nr:hypothetical protein [Deltaproteobacteria bacterium]
MKIQSPSSLRGASSSLSADGLRVLSRQKLHYTDGADAARDRPAHVRAGSGCTFIDVPGQGRRLAVVQDDAAFIALVDPRSGRVDAIELPARAGGLRHFDTARGNKMDKLDLESIATLSLDGAPALLAMGSGSDRVRETFVLVRFDGSAPIVEELPAGAFFAGMKRDKDFAGDELNVEGMVVDGDRVRFFNRGNGAGDARDAVGEVSLGRLLAHLRDPLLHAAPLLQRVRGFDLGVDTAGTRLTFTEATKHPDGRTLFLAAAEASPNAIDDGDVTGTALGTLHDDGTWSLVPLLDERGGPLTDKVEGLAVDPADPCRVWIVVDKDAANAPAELLQVRLA